MTPDNLQYNEQEIVYGLPYILRDLSHWTADTYLAHQVNQALHSGLFKRGTGYFHEYIPDLALEKPKVTSNGLTWFVEMKSGLLFDNGNELTASDVAFSYRVALTPLINNYRAHYDEYTSYENLVQLFASNESIIVVDEDTVSFTFKKPYTFALNVFSLPIIDEETYSNLYLGCVAWQNQACDWAHQGLYHGTAGPYRIKIVDYVNNSVTVHKNMNYWDSDNVWASHIQFRFIQTKEQAISALLGNTVDITDSSYMILPDDLKAINSVEFQTLESLGTSEFALNHLHPYFGTGELIPDNGLIHNDKEQARMLRQAMSHVLDRDLIVNETYNERATSAATTMPKGTVGYDERILTHQYSVQLARSIMQQIGFNYSDIPSFDIDDMQSTCSGNSSACLFEVTLLTIDHRFPLPRPEHAFSANLEKIGIGVKELIPTDWSTFIPRTFGYTNQSLVPLFDDGGYDIAYIGRSSGVDWNPAGFFDSSGLCTTGDCTNFYNFENIEVSNKVGEYLTSDDIQNRISVAYELQELLHHHIPVIPIVHHTESWTWQRDITGVDPVLLGTYSQDWGAVRKVSWESPAQIDLNITVTVDGIAIDLGSLNFQGLIFIPMVLVVLSRMRRS